MTRVVVVSAAAPAAASAATTTAAATSASRRPPPLPRWWRGCNGAKRSGPGDALERGVAECVWGAGLARCVGLCRGAKKNGGHQKTRAHRALSPTWRLDAWHTATVCVCVGREAPRVSTLRRRGRVNASPSEKALSLLPATHLLSPLSCAGARHTHTHTHTAHGTLSPPSLPTHSPEMRASTARSAQAPPPSRPARAPRAATADRQVRHWKLNAGQPALLVRNWGVAGGGERQGGGRRAHACHTSHTARRHPSPTGPTLHLPRRPRPPRLSRPAPDRGR